MAHSYTQSGTQGKAKSKVGKVAARPHLDIKVRFPRPVATKIAKRAAKESRSLGNMVRTLAEDALRQAA